MYIYTLLANRISATRLPSERPDLARVSGLIKIAHMFNH